MTLADFSPRAHSAFQALSAEEQDLVLGELSRWWSLPREQWPGDRLRTYRTSVGNFLFNIDDSLGVLLQWPTGQPAQVVAILQNQMEVVPTEKEKSSPLPVPGFLLILTILTWAVGLAFLVLGLAGGIDGLPRGEIKPYSFVEQFTVSIGALAMFVGCFVVVRTCRLA